MKQIATLLLIFITSIAQAQTGNSVCANAIQICFDNPIAYPATIGAGPAEAGPDYGCLSTRPNAAWFYFQVGTPGPHQLYITNSNNRDLDFIIYGPYAEGVSWCDSLTAAKTVDCSYAGGTTETANFTSVNTGDIYVMMITNFSNNPTNVNVIQNAGTGDFNCEFTAPCVMSLVTANPGECDTLTNQYTVTGQVWTFNPPTINTLNVSIGEQTIQLNGPFTNPMPFTFTGLPSNGDSSVVINAMFMASTNCSGTTTFIAPQGCIPCEVTVTSNSPVCQGDTLRFYTQFDGTATYEWSGPSLYTAFVQNPELLADSVEKSGTYSMVITGENCTAERSIDVEVIQAPKPEVIELASTVCEGEILFLGAIDVPGATFNWTGPNNFEAAVRSTQINNTTVSNSGAYILSLELNGCSNGTDTLNATILASPVITLNGPSQLAPTGTALFSVTGAPGMVYYWNYTGNTSLIDNVLYTSDKDSAVVFWDGGEGNLSVEVMGVDENGCQSEMTSLAVTVTYATGINNQVNQTFRLFPNPAAGEVNIEIPEESMNLRLLDLTGRVLMQRDRLSKGTTTLFLQDQPAGFYWIELKNDQHTFSKKLVISK